jgi:hypothetical protein
MPKATYDPGPTTLMVFSNVHILWCELIHELVDAVSVINCS